MSLEYLDKQPCSLKETKSFIGNGVDFLIKKIMDLRFIPEFETLRSLFLNNYKKVYLNNSPKYLDVEMFYLKFVNQLLLILLV